MATPIHDFFELYAKKDIYPFHMPGHKRNDRFFDFNTPLWHMDVTEIDGADNLRSPNGILCETQERMAALYGARRTFMLVNGSSAGIVSALLAACGNGGGVVLARNAHISAYNGVVLADARPVYIDPDMTEYGIAGGICPKKLETLLKLHREHINAVFITSPTYEGFCSDIQKIAAIVHRYDKLLIVDEAHGAHFGFHEAFPESAVTLGADIVIQSLHKTLPTLNQSALLHVCGGHADAERIGRCLSMMQTTSPSYILMAVMEKCAHLLESESHALFAQYAQLLQNARAALKDNRVIQLLDHALIGQASIANIDAGKLVFVLNCDASGSDIEARLRECAGVEMEMSGLRHMIAMTSVADEPFGFDRLVSGINTLNKSLNFYDKTFRINHMHDHRIVAPLTPREAAFSKSRPTPLDVCAGRVAGGFVIPYPPGIPVVVPGEYIDADTLSHIKTCLLNNIPVLGAENGFVDIINEDENT